MLKRSSFIASAGAATFTAVQGEAAVLAPRRADGRFSGNGVSREKVTYAAFINQSGNEFGVTFGSATKDGYVLISLETYGDVGNELYASVWVKRTLPYGWLCLYGISLGSLGYYFSQYPGYIPISFSCTGDANSQTVSLVAYQLPAYWYYYYGISAAQFQTYDAQLRAQNFELSTAAVYGDPGAPQYLAAWYGHSTSTPWVDAYADTSATLAARVVNEHKAGYRPKFVARNANGVYASKFQDDNVGPWLEQHEMSAATYEKLYATMTSRGYFPISLRAAGHSSAPVFAAVFAGTDTPIPAPRKLTITGKAVPAFSAIETEITRFMQTNSVRAGQLTIAKKGVVQYERAFTWAETGYPITQTTSLFRLASVSKAFVEAAVQTLFNRKLLLPTTPVFHRLGFSKPKDSRSDSITVQELLDHTGGYDDTIVADPVFSMRAIANGLNQKTPITISEFVRYMYQQPLQHAPGTTYAYSNSGYVILSYLISVVSGMPFIEFIQKEVMAPLGVKSGIYQTRTAQNLRLGGEVFFEDDEVGYSALEPTSPVLIPDAYGGDQLLHEVAEGASAITTSATVVTTLIHTWLVWGNGKRPAPGNWYWQRDGSMPGTTAVAGSRGSDGVDFCFVFNTRNWAPGAGASPPDDLATAINTLLNRLGSADERFAAVQQRAAQPLPYLGDTLLRRRKAEEALRIGR